MMKNGFTILEVILAIFILTVAVFASFALIQQTITGASLNQSKLIAYYLAQEGIENVRNIRDTNWLQRDGWKEGIQNSEETVSFWDGTQSKFKREIIIGEKKDDENNDYLEIKVIIEWAERERGQSIEAISHLYNWYEK